MEQESNNGHLSILREYLKKIRNLLNQARAKQVQAQSIINSSKELVIKYFNDIRPVFQSCGLDNESLGGLDNWMQQLLNLSQKSSLKSRYDAIVKSISQELNGIEVALITTSTDSPSSSTGKMDGKEQRIATTIASLVESAGLSYKQACLDLRDNTRLSYRGAAAELREALREVLDHLAPDKKVTSQENFKFEKDQKKPTMKQKVQYILKSRGKNKSQTEAPESAVALVEERVGALARSVYTRSSVSTHISTSKQEVQQIKAYIDVVLGELLEIA
ncbi:MAG: hypothetical protein DRQ49_18400 [Gammaproteobacteria bacterium]|nr:MAG: hypothetical protein DRQ49_18400 [Gammaproteobacteria bacterium]